MIEIGRTILVEKPYVFILKSTLKNERCDFCFQITDLKKCSKCQYSQYCGLNCQRSAWSLHKLECANLRKIHPKILPDSAHLLIRLILKLKNEEHDTKKKKRRFVDLMSHFNEIKYDKRRMEHFTALLVVLHSFFDESEVIDNDYVLELFGKMCINSFNILDNDMNSLGTGIYLNASILDHSCKPNAVAVFEETTIHIRSITNIPEFNWSLIKISYIDILNTSRNRKKELEQMYYFICDCERCTHGENDDIMNSMQCANLPCEGYVPILEETDPVCSICKTRAPEQNIKIYKEMVKLAEYHIKNMENKDMAYIDVCEMILEKQKSVFHERNIYRVKLLDLAMESSVNLERWNTALKYGLLLVTSFSEFYGLYHPLVGLIYFKVLKLLVLNNERDSRRNGFLKQAVKILLVTHGREHPLFKNLQAYTDELNFEQI